MVYLKTLRSLNNISGVFNQRPADAFCTAHKYFCIFYSSCWRNSYHLNENLLLSGYLIKSTIASKLTTDGFLLPTRIVEITKLIVKIEIRTGVKRLNKRKPCQMMGDTRWFKYSCVQKNALGGTQHLCYVILCPWPLLSFNQLWSALTTSTQR
jgi:hypothetical protein